MDITVSQTQGQAPVTILQPHGVLDAANYQDLVAKAQELYEAGTRDILLDLSDISYMSSSGIVAVQSLASLLRDEKPPGPEAGWWAYRTVDRDPDLGFQEHLKLLSPQPRVDKVLEMVGFTRFLKVYTDLETAVASF